MSIDKKTVSFRSQSAMEYLMTYGWAILIIAVVLGALFSLGIFNSATFAPKVQPGGCQVYRPYGPGTSSHISIQGICNNELPEYVMKSTGVGGFVFIPDSNTESSLANIQGQAMTITAWVYIMGNPFHDIVDKEGQYGMKLNYMSSSGCVVGSENSIISANSLGLCLEWDTSANWTGISYFIPGGGFKQWIFLAVSVDGNNKYWYANGKEIGSGTNDNPNTPISYFDENLTFGAISQNGPVNAITGNQIYTGFSSNEFFNGTISNIQIYNSSLSPAEISYLYQEGIGGVPVDLNNLVGWWPLNGNTKDYSGNGEDGIPNNMIFTNGWVYSYTPP